MTSMLFLCPEIRCNMQNYSQKNLLPLNIGLSHINMNILHVLCFNFMLKLLFPPHFFLIILNFWPFVGEDLKTWSKRKLELILPNNWRFIFEWLIKIMGESNIYQTEEYPKTIYCWGQGCQVQWWRWSMKQPRCLRKYCEEVSLMLPILPPLSWPS